MPRQLRIQYEGAIYHLMSRGDRREEIFRDDLDREDFLKTLGAARQKTGWQVHGYCLMSNHFHLVNGIIDARFQSSSPISVSFCVRSEDRPHSLFGT
jgi:putative transposase